MQIKMQRHEKNHICIANTLYSKLFNSRQLTSCKYFLCKQHETIKTQWITNTKEEPREQTHVLLQTLCLHSFKYFLCGSTLKLGWWGALFWNRFLMQLGHSGPSLSDIISKSELGPTWVNNFGFFFIPSVVSCQWDQFQLFASVMNWAGLFSVSRPVPSFSVAPNRTQLS